MRILSIKETLIFYLCPFISIRKERQKEGIGTSEAPLFFRYKPVMHSFSG
jgi:hypothetical protein